MLIWCSRKFQFLLHNIFDDQKVHVCEPAWACCVKQSGLLDVDIFHSSQKKCTCGFQHLAGVEPDAVHVNL